MINSLGAMDIRHSSFADRGISESANRDITEPGCEISEFWVYSISHPALAGVGV